MSRNPFDPLFEELPRELPIFPLPGVLVLPGCDLPLNIFEPRYLQMVFDVLGQSRMIGMIQPRSPKLGQEEEPALGAPPPIYGMGCAGRITAFAETGNGRLIITLTGLLRFQVLEELPPLNGYRRTHVSYEGFRKDLDRADGECLDQSERQRLIKNLKPYLLDQGMSIDWDKLQETPDERLISALAMICPFAPQEKQALLECGSLAERSRMIVTLMEMCLATGPSTKSGSAPN